MYNFHKGDIILVTDENGNFYKIRGEVISYDETNEKVYFRLIAHDYKGIVTYDTAAKNCVLLERHGIRQNLND